MALIPNLTANGGDELDVPADASSLDFLRAVYRSPSQPMARRMRAAQIAVEYEHPRLAVTALMDGKAIGAALERALKRSGKFIDRSSPPLIEHQLSEAIEPR